MSISVKGKRSVVKMRRSTQLNALCVVVFVVDFVFINWFLSTRDIDRIPPSQLWIPVYVMGGVALVCTILMPSKPFILTPIAIASILVGVAFDALTDRTMNRNLFPIEMVIWAGISTPGILVGNLTGWLFYWLKKEIAQHRAVGPPWRLPAKGHPIAL